MKSVLLTLSSTLAIAALAASLFLNTILGVFGLVASSAETLQSLQTSQNVVEKMKKRQQGKRIQVSKRFAKKSVKRIATTALAAATIGTVAVAVTMTTFEIADFCEEKKQLQEDDNILYGTHIVFDYEQCLLEAQEDSEAFFVELKDSSTTAVSNALNDTAIYGEEKWLTIKEASMDAFLSTSDAVSALWDSAESWFVEWE